MVLQVHVITRLLNSTLELRTIPSDFQAEGAGVLVLTPLTDGIWPGFRPAGLLLDRIHGACLSEGWKAETQPTDRLVGHIKQSVQSGRYL